MPIKVKSADQIAAKWARVAPTREADYREGVQDPDVDWARATEASKEAYEAGVQESITDGRFAKGVARAGNEKWKAKTTELGTARWAGGVRAATGDMQAGIEPFVEALQRIDLPPRRPRGDPANLERSAIVARKLNEVRKRG